MKKIIVFLAFLPLLATAQIPAGYYNSALGLNGQQLRYSLYNKIKGHTELTYTPGLWNAYATTDAKAGGKLWDIYSDKPGGTPAYEFTMVTGQCTGNSPSAEGGCYNREHLWPRSKFNSQAPMYTDLWIVYPTDYWVNSKRADFAYGKVQTAQFTSTNGSKLGTINSSLYPGTPAGIICFEPIDSFKGDVARNYFYVATRYLADSNTFVDWEMANKLTLKPWAIQMLLDWHHNDPVSAKEIARNNAVYAIQKNRNPFIDYPQFADCIWGTGDCSTLSVAGRLTQNSYAVFPNPATDKVQVHFTAGKKLVATIYNQQGQIIYQDGGTAADYEIDVHTWAKGLYFLQLQTSEGIAIEKVLVK